MRYWKKKNGDLIGIKEMSTPHIENCLRMLKRKGFIGLKTLTFYLSCQPPTADGALMVFEQESNRIFDAPVCSFIDSFEKELKIRKVIK